MKLLKHTFTTLLFLKWDGYLTPEFGWLFVFTPLIIGVVLTITATWLNIEGNFNTRHWESWQRTNHSK